MAKRQTVFDHRRERGDDGRIFVAGPRKENHRKKPFKLNSSMCQVYCLDDPSMILTISKTKAKELLTANNRWRYLKKG